MFHRLCRIILKLAPAVTIQSNEQLKRRKKNIIQRAPLLRRLTHLSSFTPKCLKYKRRSVVSLKFQKDLWEAGILQQKNNTLESIEGSDIYAFR